MVVNANSFHSAKHKPHLCGQVASGAVQTDQQRPQHAPQQRSTLFRQGISVGGAGAEGGRRTHEGRDSGSRQSLTRRRVMGRPELF